MGLRVAIILLALAASALAQSLPAASDGEHVWAALSVGEEKTLTLWHHAPGDPDNHMRRVEELRGKLMSGAGIAAGSGSLWLVYGDRSVQHVRPVPGSVPGHWAYHAERLRELPNAEKLRCITGDAAGPWALVTIDNPDTLVAVDAPPPAVDDTEALSIILDLPPDELQGALPPTDTQVPATSDEATDEKASDEEASESPPPAEPAPEPATRMAPVDCLLHLVGSSWQRVPLPEDWPHTARSAAICDPQRPGRPLLLAQTVETRSRPPVLSVYEPVGDDDWERTDYKLGSHVIWSAALVGGQLVLAQRPGGATVDLSVLHRGAIHRLATVNLPPVADESAPRSNADWTLLGFADAAALVTVSPDDEPGLSWTLIDLRGRVMREMTPIVVDPRAARVQRMQYGMMVAVIVLSLLMLFVFWQRDPRVHRPRLDDKTRVGQLWKRMAAGAIDLIPGSLAVVIYYGVSFAELRTHWRQLQLDPIAAEPALAAIGLFTLYTLTLELITGTTPGKRMLGLRVADLNGVRPHAWQILVRNGLKAFDLVAPLLLVLPLLSPHRQRLGDLVARTLVVEPKDETDESKDAKKDDE